MLLTLKGSKFCCTLTIGQWTFGPITPSLPPPPDRPSNMESLPLIAKSYPFNSIVPFFQASRCAGEGQPAAGDRRLHRVVRPLHSRRVPPSEAQALLR